MARMIHPRDGMIHPKVGFKQYCLIGPSVIGKELGVVKTLRKQKFQENSITSQ